MGERFSFSKKGISASLLRGKPAGKKGKRREKARSYKEGRLGGLF